MGDQHACEYAVAAGHRVAGDISQPVVGERGVTNERIALRSGGAGEPV